MVQLLKNVYVLHSVVAVYAELVHSCETCRIMDFTTVLLLIRTTSCKLLLMWFWPCIVV